MDLERQKRGARVDKAEQGEEEEGTCERQKVTQGYF